MYTVCYYYESMSRTTCGTITTDERIKNKQNMKTSTTHKIEVQNKPIKIQIIKATVIQI